MKPRDVTKCVYSDYEVPVIRTPLELKLHFVSSGARFKYSNGETSHFDRYALAVHRGCKFYIAFAGAVMCGSIASR